MVSNSGFPFETYLTIRNQDLTMAQRTALEPVASNGSAEGGWNQGNGFTVSTEPVAVGKQVAISSIHITPHDITT